MSAFVKQSDLRRETPEWGEVAWRSSPGDTGSKQLTVMDVKLGPGKGHSFHRHPDQEEMIIVKSGRVEQWLEHERTTLEAGDSVYVDKDVVHASFNDGDEDAHLQVVLGPAVGEGGYEVVDVFEQEPWRSLR